MLWFANECRRNGIRLESCVRLAENAGDPELAEFFERAHFASHTALVEGDVYDERGWSGGQLR